MLYKDNEYLTVWYSMKHAEADNPRDKRRKIFPPAISLSGSLMAMNWHA